MTNRRRIRVDVDLPELTPSQADFLWNFLEDLAMDLWDAYERELLEIENERSCPPGLENDWTAAAQNDAFDNAAAAPRDAVNDKQSDPDF